MGDLVVFFLWGKSRDLSVPVPKLVVSCSLVHWTQYGPEKDLTSSSRNMKNVALPGTLYMFYDDLLDIIIKKIHMHNSLRRFLSINEVTLFTLDTVRFKQIPCNGCNGIKIPLAVSALHEFALVG